MAHFYSFWHTFIYFVHQSLLFTHQYIFACFNKLLLTFESFCPIFHTIANFFILFKYVLYNKLKQIWANQKDNYVSVMKPVFLLLPSCLKKYSSLQKWPKIVIWRLLRMLSLNPWCTLFDIRSKTQECFKVKQLHTNIYKTFHLISTIYFFLQTIDASIVCPTATESSIRRRSVLNSFDNATKRILELLSFVLSKEFC